MIKSKKSNPTTIEDYLKNNKIATLDQLKEELRTNSTMTVFRRLKRLGYVTSYSHRGKYYSLNSIAAYDKIGLWSFNSVWFSKFGNLIETATEFVEQSKSGFSAGELTQILNAEVKHPLLRLFKQKRLYRKKIENKFVYFSLQPEKRKQQLTLRKTGVFDVELNVSYEIDVFRDELKAAIILFYSLLDEKQRRLYAGLESFKLGHGGDKKMAELLGLDSHTVAKGRRELISGEIHPKGVREKGGGRKSSEKKSQKSSSKSKKF
jgi:predicted transcriptional regulator